MTTRTSDEIFQVSDLNRRGKVVMDAAREHRARIRDTDGGSFVLLREDRLVDLEALASMAVNLATVERGRSACGANPLTPADMGEWTWLRHLPEEDLAEFVTEVREALIHAVHERDHSIATRVVADWQVTARALADADRRSVLLGSPDDSDFVEARRPFDAA
jgi:hypothetical protein